LPTAARVFKKKGVAGKNVASSRSHQATRKDGEDKLETVLNLLALLVQKYKY
jgi:hypothetical protein